MLLNPSIGHPWFCYQQFHEYHLNNRAILLLMNNNILTPGELKSPSFASPHTHLTSTRKQFVVIPEDDMRWAMEQKPAVIRLFFECWLSERYGSRWMPLNTGLKDKTLKQAKAALRKAGLFEFKSEMRILEGERYYETLLINLHGIRQDNYWKPGGIVYNPTSSNGVAVNPTTSSSKPEIGYSESLDGVIDNPTSRTEPQSNQGIQDALISLPITPLISSSGLPNSTTGEEDIKVLEEKTEEVDRDIARPKVESTVELTASLLTQQKPTAQMKDSDRDRCSIESLDNDIDEDENAEILKWVMEVKIPGLNLEEPIRNLAAYAKGMVKRDGDALRAEFAKVLEQEESYRRIQVFQKQCKVVTEQVKARAEQWRETGIGVRVIELSGHTPLVIFSGFPGEHVEAEDFLNMSIGHFESNKKFLQPKNSKNHVGH